MRAVMGCFLMAFAAAGQESVIRTETRLVEVSVTAVDRNNKPVSDLTIHEFSITDEGKPQAIANFSAFGPRGGAQAAGAFTNRTLSGSVTVILMDGMNVPFASQGYARDQLIRWLRAPGGTDRIAILALDSKLELLHDFTSDHEALIAALERYSPKSDPRLQPLPPPPANNPAAGSASDPFAIMVRQWSDYNNPVRLRSTVAAMEQIAATLSRFRDRKNLIWLSGDIPIYVPGAAMSDAFRAFEQESRKAIQVLSNAGVAVYPVNPRGLASLGSASDTRMEALARDTGGKAFFSSNNLTKVFGDVTDESRSGYTLTYYPTSVATDDRFHTIHVTIQRPGVKLTYRSGYFAASAAASSSDEIPLEKAPLLKVVASGMEYTGIGLDAKLQQESGEVRVTVTIDGNDLAMTQKNGEWVGAADFLIAAGNTGSNSFQGDPDRLNLKLKPEVWAKVQKEGLIMTKSIPAPEGVDQLRIVVRDATTGMAGSLVIPLRTAAIHGGEN